MNTRPYLTTLWAAAFAASTGLALAQSPPPDQPAVTPPKAESADSRACGPGGPHATVGQGGDIVVRKPNDETLSSRLADSGGVICPPRRVDPEITAPTPPAGPTPVIPPGALEGRPPAQPK